MQIIATEPYSAFSTFYGRYSGGPRTVVSSGSCVGEYRILFRGSTGDPDRADQSAVIAEGDAATATMIPTTFISIGNHRSRTDARPLASVDGSASLV
ncbi:hypothetical protein FHW16_005601 [Phyllobacterium myrsinacearum]|uniref:Uncharacterized protein n=1 Tax=Phyllobacterium myrsinacearum TaxID=28101 RepID=A0A839EWF5_9HYPH|nr:hypothetical protein [Phyllobacterium myrsinacearum]